MALTDSTCRTAKGREKIYRLHDTGGLYLQVHPNGSRYFRLKYRIGGKARTLALGVYPEVALADARKQRDEARKLIREGTCPSLAKRTQKAAKIISEAQTFRAVAEEWHAKQAPVWAPAHADRVLARLQRDIFPWLGPLPVTGIDPPLLLATLRRVEERGAIESARRTLQTCRAIFTYAGIRPNPAADLSANLAPTKPGNFAAITDPTAIGELLRAMDGFTGSFVVKCALRLAPLVFVRPGELRTMAWADVDLAAREWRYRVTKTEVDHVVPLSDQAVEIMRELQPLTGRGRYVFPSARSSGGHRPMSDVALLAGLRRLGYDKDAMTVHGFRAMARTVLDEVLGFRVDLIEHQLAHAVKDPLGRAYNRTAHLPERRAMMQQWSDYLDTLRAGHSNVIPLKAVAG